jgi:hypothetical protein
MQTLVRNDRSQCRNESLGPDVLRSGTENQILPNLERGMRKMIAFRMPIERVIRSVTTGVWLIVSDVESLCSQCCE